MIFHDQETADEFRKQADKELTDFIVNIIGDVLSHPVSFKNATEDLKQEFVKSKMVNLPDICKTLLYKSGLIYPVDSSGIYPVLTYYDNDKDYQLGTVLSAMHSLHGGIKNGRIHT